MKEKIIINKTINKKEIKEITNWFTNNFGPIKTTKLLDKLKLLGFKYATKTGTSLGIKDLKIPISKKNLINNNKKKIDKLKHKIKKGKITTVDYEIEIQKKWNQINEILKEEINDNFRKTDLLNPLYVMVTSGARGNMSQIKQLVGMRGLMADPKGEIINIPILNNLKEALNIIEYFISCYGARKGVIDTAIKTAVSGYLTRKLIYVGQDQVIKRPNCNTKDAEMIINTKKNKKYYKLSFEKILGRVLAKDIKNDKINLVAGQDICNYLAKKILNFKKIFLRTPLTCKVNFGICQLCYGWNLANNRIAELGEAVGVIAAQSIGEPGTQLTMRTFHTGGIFSEKAQETILSPINGIIYYNSKIEKRIIKTPLYSNVLLTLKEKKLIIINNKENRFLINLPKYSIIFVRNKEKVFEKQIIGEILNKRELNNRLKNTTKNNKLKGIKNKASGKIYFQKNNNPEKKQELFVIHGNIIPKEKIMKNLNIKDHYKIKNILKIKNDKIIKSEKNIKVQTSKLINTIISKKLQIEKMNKAKGKKEIKLKVIYTVQRKKNEKNEILINKRKKTKIVNTKKDNKPYKKINDNKKLYKNKKYCSYKMEKRNQILILEKISMYDSKKSSLINKEIKRFVKKDTIIIYTEYETKKTKDIVQGLPKIEEILENKKLKQQMILDSIFSKMKRKNKRKIAIKKSIYKLQIHLTKKIQSVYSSQGINISNKHIEVIIKKLTSKGIVKNSGESNLINGEILELNKIEKMNKKFEKKIIYEPLIIGISKSSASNMSIISKICFGGVIENLANGAIQGKIDWLNGIKENIILGNIIPVGTGTKKIY